ncbi:uncharacterized protein BO66DRAFT_411178 [Aspergillus aculeatinus CBS 121060]|uniref:Uncharacterized protein n=1 Tax=Aspergillus aculeatinus CBS 121060 TaxID=1448322 RepID=A0ACD1HAV8_9EURO|nr:hypothetical protein BO66DRAFT_411178 [Aspergillus aculeatinus CBS 121060]RAH70510.1 hypothetical protein BO66DRAFT_411178 [Aspergillus aculeatinus CBS 121060]
MYLRIWILTLARTPLPKIGSFVLDENGYLSLSNRPLTLEIQQLENEHIPVDIPRNVTHNTVDSYLNDVIAFHESRLRHQPNAIKSLEDGFYQTAALMTNVFVDDNWNIKCLIDLEWACSHPVQMIHPPYWLTNQAIDLVNSDEYERFHAEFMAAFAEEELQINPPISLHSILQQGWERGTFWCALALSSPTALFSKTHDDPSFWRITMPYWTFNTFAFIEQKVKDKEPYDVSLREAFQFEACETNAKPMKQLD